jgi:hypothetical protein
VTGAELSCTPHSTRAAKTFCCLASRTSAVSGVGNYFTHFPCAELGITLSLHF